MMLYSERLGELMRGLVGERTLRDFAAEAGCDPTLVHHMRNQGRVPRRDTLTRIADNLRLEGATRAELFAAAGYIELPALRVRSAA